MLLRETEAKCKYCPLLTTPEGKFRCCQGSMCMMWRWSHGERHDGVEVGYCGLAMRPEGGQA